MAKKTGIITDPITAANFGSEASSLFENFRSNVDVLRAQRKTMRAQGQAQRKDIRRQGRENMWSAVGAANDRGVLGSSVDVASRAAVRGDTAAQIIAARDALKQGMVANYSQQMAARRGYETDFLNLMQMRAASKAGSAMEDYVAGLLDQRGGGGRGGQPQATTGGKRRQVLVERLANRRQDIHGIMDQLRALAQGGVSMGEVDQVEALKKQVREEWMRRNRILRKLGRDPRSQNLLQNRLHTILNPQTAEVGSGVSHLG